MKRMLRAKGEGRGVEQAGPSPFRLPSPSSGPPQARLRWLLLAGAVLLLLAGAVRHSVLAARERSARSGVEISTPERGPGTARVQAPPVPEPPDPFLARLQASVAREGVDSVLARCEREAAAKPRDVEAQAALGVLYFVRGRAGAQRALERAALLGSRHAMVYHALGTFYRDRGDLEPAAEAFRKAALFSPERPRAHFSLGLALLELEELRDAIAALRRATELAPGYVEAHLALAQAHSIRAEAGEAEAALRRCLALDPGSHPAWYELGRLCMSVGRFDEAERAFRQALALREDRPEYHRGLAQACLQRPDGSAGAGPARAALRRSLELDPSSADTHYLLGDLSRREGKLRESVRAFRGAVRRKPDAAHFRYALAQVLRQLGEEEEALRHLERVRRSDWSRQLLFAQREVDFNPDDPRARYHLGSLYEREKEYARAARQFRVLARLEPRKPRAHERLARIYKRLGDLRRARESESLAARLRPKGARGEPS